MVQKNIYTKGTRRRNKRGQKSIVYQSGGRSIEKRRTEH